MELRHLRYFVAEEKSITVAATRRLRTAQPSLSRQLRELETEVGAGLMTRSAQSELLARMAPGIARGRATAAEGNQSSAYLWS
jgi:DNA-binding transcriptional LysR family regulator